MTSPHDRIAAYAQKSKVYTASTTELLLEQICGSFGTELLKADVKVTGPGRTIMTRMSKPVIVEHPAEGKKLLQFQLTRFTPLHSQRAIEIYIKNRGKKRISRESAMKEIVSRHSHNKLDVLEESKWDVLEEITNGRYIENLNLHRWEKKLYFAVYDIDNIKFNKRELKPFYIHEWGQVDRKMGIFHGEFPQTHITFEIEPCFFIGMQGEEGIKDTLTFRFPKKEVEYIDNMNTALSMHPLDHIMDLTSLRNAYANIVHELPSTIPRKLTMGLITAYLRKLCLDKDFY